MWYKYYNPLDADRVQPTLFIWRTMLNSKRLLANFIILLYETISLDTLLYKNNV